MTDRILSRRRLLARGAGLIAVCGPIPGPARAAEPACFDPDQGDPYIAKMLHYTEASQDPGKKCDACIYFREPAKQCGMCEVLMGSVAAAGTCDNWAKKK